jgi:hypothetical protein
MEMNFVDKKSSDLNNRLGSEDWKYIHENRCSSDHRGTTQVVVRRA